MLVNILLLLFTFIIICHKSIVTVMQSYRTYILQYNNVVNNEWKNKNDCTLIITIYRFYIILFYNNFYFFMLKLKISNCKFKILTTIIFFILF